jgi:hypothetical protein
VAQALLVHPRWGGIIESMGASDDDRVIREMLAPNLDDALYALAFWVRRRTRLPFYRRAARREAERMIAFWQARAISDASRSPAALFAAGGTAARVVRLTVGYHARRVLARMTTVMLMTMMAVTTVIVLAGR